MEGSRATSLDTAAKRHHGVRRFLLFLDFLASFSTLAFATLGSAFAFTTLGSALALTGF